LPSGPSSAGGHSALVQDLDGGIGDLADRAARVGLLPERADRGLGRAVELEHLLEAEPLHEALDVGRGGAVPEGVAELVPGVVRHLGRDPLLVAAVLLLDRAEHVVHGLADVVPVRHAELEAVGHEARRGEALAHRERAAHVERGMKAQVERVRVEERHARVADVVLVERQVARHGHADREHLHVVVDDALREPGRPRRVDDDERPREVDVDAGRVHRAERADLVRDACEEVVALDGRARIGAQHEDVLGRDVLEPTLDARDLAGEALIDDEEPRARLVQQACERVAAEPRVDAEEGMPEVAAAAVERHQLEVVLEQHRHVAGTRVVARAETAREEMRDADRLVAVALVRPRAVALQQERPAAHLGMGGARVDLDAEGERGIEAEACHGDLDP
jgi:hypothetical protein